MSENYQSSSRYIPDNSTSLDRKDNYFLIKIDVNQKDEIQVTKAQNHSLELTRKQQRKMRTYENKAYKAILFDIRQNFVSIWGTANVTFGKEMSQNVPYVKTSNFEPISPIINGKIKAKWLPERFTRYPWTSNKTIRIITKDEYLDMLRSVVEAKELFSGMAKNSGQTIKDNTQKPVENNFQETNNLPDLSLEIPTIEILENGIKQIESNLLIDKKTIEEIVVHLTSGRHILLAGPIGTGKTRLAELIPKLFWLKEERGYDTQVYTASNEWNVNDVIGGIVPRMKEGNPTYQIQLGCSILMVK